MHPRPELVIVPAPAVPVPDKADNGKDPSRRCRAPIGLALVYEGYPCLEDQEKIVGEDDTMEPEPSHANDIVANPAMESDAQTVVAVSSHETILEGLSGHVRIPEWLMDIFKRVEPDLLKTMLQVATSRGRTYRKNSYSIRGSVRIHLPASVH